MASISELATQLSELKQKKSDLTNDIKDINKQVEAIETELLEEFAHQGMNRVDIKGLGCFYIATRRFYRVEDKEKFHDFLHDQGHTDMLKVPHQTLNAYCKELAEKSEEAGDEVEIPGVEFKTKTAIRIRKN